jgi:hypothetical protein
MSLIWVVYKDKKKDFDYVTEGLLDRLIIQDEITHFYRPSERKWINIRIDPVRGWVSEYQGPERRGTYIKPKSIEEKRGPNSQEYGSDWLKDLWRLIEDRDARS